MRRAARSAGALKQLAESGRLEVQADFRARARIREARRQGLVDRRPRAPTERARRIDGIDEIIVATGGRPDLVDRLRAAREARSLDREHRALAPLIDPNVHSCGTVRPHGHRELAHPEARFYAVGAKSYGRAPNFLLATGYEQVRSVVAALAGDLAAADDVQLELPETGVCSTQFDEASSGCCTTGEAEPIAWPAVRPASRVLRRPPRSARTPAAAGRSAKDAGAPRMRMRQPR